jgi:preprotein translocase subunit SecG
LVGLAALMSVRSVLSRLTSLSFGLWFGSSISLGFLHMVSTSGPLVPSLG